MSRARDWIGRQLMRLSGASRLQPNLVEIIERINELSEGTLLRQRQWQRYMSLAELRRRYPDEFEELSGFELSVFSQNGEDGVLLEILHRIGTGPRSFVEFGADDGTENCCSLLADVLGWSGLFAELDEERFARLSAKYQNNDNVSTVNCAITPENVEAIFRAADVPAQLDVLSIDVDGSDFWIWQSLQDYRPRVVIIEYNSSLDATKPLVQPRDSPGWDHTTYFGASIAAMSDLARSKGYTLVHLEQVGTNAFFVRDDLLWPDARPPILRGPNYDLAGNQHFPDRQHRSYIDPGIEEL